MHKEGRSFKVIQVNTFIFQRPPETFYKNIIHPPSFAIHKDCDLIYQEQFCKNYSSILRIWTKGNTYYLCQTKGCSKYEKFIRRDQIEGDFEALLKTVQPTKPYTEVVTTMFKDTWHIQKEKAKDAANAFKAEVICVDKEIETFLQRIMNATNERVIRTY